MGGLITHFQSHSSNLFAGTSANEFADTFNYATLMIFFIKILKGCSISDL